MGEGSVRMFFNVLMDTGLHVPTATIGLVMGTAQLLPIGVALALPLLLARWGTGYTLLGGIVALAACLLPVRLGRADGDAGRWLGRLGGGADQRRLPGPGGDNDRAGYSARHVWPGDRDRALAHEQPGRRHVGPGVWLVGRGRRGRGADRGLWFWRLVFDRRAGSADGGGPAAGLSAAGSQAQGGAGVGIRSARPRTGSD